MVNPYEPPRDEIRYSPFSKRLRRAVSLAVNEYRRGMKREGLVGRRHFGAWLSLFTVTFFAIGLIVSMAFGFWNMLRGF